MIRLFKDKRYAITFGIILAILINLHRLFLHNWLGLGIWESVVDSIVHTVFLSFGVMLINLVFYHYRPKKDSITFVVIFTTVLSILWFGLTYLVLKSILGFKENYLNWFIDVVPIRWFVGWMVLTCTGFITYLLYTNQEKSKEEERLHRLEKLSREAELSKLRQQLQPHFLFNSLNSINALVGSRPMEAREMIQKLSDFLRGTLKREDQSLVKFQEDLQYLQLYLDIERVRFRHRLAIEIQATEESLQAQIPPLILQPVVENAIKFGVYETTGAITIGLYAQMVDSTLHITITNPFDEQMLVYHKGNGFGLKAIARRLHLLYGRLDLLETHREESTFTTLIKVPQNND
jgi:two-component system LytT family sensor kinase